MSLREGGSSCATHSSTSFEKLSSSSTSGAVLTVGAAVVPAGSGETLVAEAASALELGVARLGHATRLADDPKLVAETARRGVAVEVNLTSNVRTGSVRSIEDHPARRLHDAGVPLSFNTDDRGLFGIDLTHEYEQAGRAGFPFAELATIATRAVDQLFLSEPDRAALRRSFEGAEARS